MKMGILFMLLTLMVVQPILLFAAAVDRNQTSDEAGQIAAESNMLQAIKNQTSYTLEEIQNICQGRYLIDVPSLNCSAINLCLNYGLSIPECYDDLFLSP